MKWNLFCIIATVILFQMGALCCHEWGHYIMGRIMGGGQVCVSYPHFFGGYCEFEFVPDHLWLVGFSGGAIACIAFAFLWAMAHWLPTKWDIYVEFAAALIATQQLGYAIVEVYTIQDKASDLFYLIPLLASIAIILPIYFKPLLRLVRL